MPKIKIKTPPYSLVACDLSAAEVRTAANAAQDKEMIKAYKAFKYEKEFTNSIELYSYERLNTTNGYKSLHILTTEDILLDKDENQVKIVKLEDEGDKNKLILGDNNPHTFIVDKPGQDLYSLIASKAYNNKYEDNLEFYPEGTKITFDGKEVICGNDKEFSIKETQDSSRCFQVPNHLLILTPNGYIKNDDLMKGIIVSTDEGEKEILNIIKSANSTLIYV